MSISGRWFFDVSSLKRTGNLSYNATGLWGPSFFRDTDFFVNGVRKQYVGDPFSGSFSVIPTSKTHYTIKGSFIQSWRN